MQPTMFDGVTVVIPTFNRPQFLPSTIQSVLDQTRPAKEIIVVNNGTVGDIPEIVARFGDKVRLIHQAPGGVQRARNAGIDAARSNWLATLDDDDLYHPTFLEMMEPAMKDGRANIVFGDHRKFKGDTVFPKTNFESAPNGYWNGVAKSDDMPWTFVDKFPIRRILSFIGFYPSTMIIRRDLFDDVGGYDPRVYGIPTEDIEFLIRVLSVGRLAIVWNALVDYRIHDSNTAGGYDRQRIGRWRIFEFIAENNLDLPDDFKLALAENLLARRRDIFDFSFHKGKFDVTRSISSKLGSHDWTARRRLYRAVAALPAPFNATVGKVVAVPRRLQTFVRRRFGPPKSVPNP